MWSLRVLVHLFLPMEAHSESCLDLWNEYSSYGYCFLAMKLGVTLFFFFKACFSEILYGKQDLSLISEMP